MNIDISHRLKNNGGRKVNLQDNKKRKKIFSFNIVAIATLFFVAVGLVANSYFFKLDKVLYLFFSFIGYAAVPLSSFLTAHIYNHARNVRKTVIILGIFALVTHIPYTLLNTGEFVLISQTSLIFPLFMGCTVLMLSDMPNIDRNVKSALILLICFIASIGDGGSASTIWLIFFGSNYDKQTKTKLFYTIGFVITVINLIYGIIGGQWYSFIPVLGFLIAVPFINNFNSLRTDVSKGLIYAIFYPVLITGIFLIKIFIN